MSNHHNFAKNCKQGLLNHSISTLSYLYITSLILSLLCGNLNIYSFSIVDIGGIYFVPKITRQIVIVEISAPTDNNQRWPTIMVLYSTYIDQSYSPKK